MTTGAAHQHQQFEFGYLDYVIALIGLGRPLEPGEFTRVAVFHDSGGFSVTTDAGDKLPLLNQYGSEGWQVVTEQTIESTHPLAAAGLLLAKIQETVPVADRFTGRFDRHLLMRKVEVS